MSSEMFREFASLLGQEVKVAARAALESPQKLSPPLEAEEHAGDLEDAEVEVLNQERGAREAGRVTSEMLREFAKLSGLKEEEVQVAG